MTANPFSSPALSQYMAGALPRDASPQLKSVFDVVALAAHAVMLAAGFRLLGLGEDDRLEPLSDPADSQALPTSWNATAGSYSFKYAHTRSSMEFIVKVSRMGSKAVIIGIALGDDKTCSFDITAKEFVLDSNLPGSPLSAEASEVESAEAISRTFLSTGRLSDFGSLMLVRIVQKLAPGLHKQGVDEAQEAETSQRDRDARREPEAPVYDPLREERDPPARPFPLQDPLVEPPRPRRQLPDPMPGFDDEHELLRPLRGGPPGAGFPRIGDRDLYPAGLGPNDPFRGGLGPGLDPMGGGGMHPTFDDPLFAGQGRRGPGYDPRAPPGSRYDPVGPDLGGHPRGAGMGGRPPNPFGGYGDGDFI